MIEITTICSAFLLGSIPFGFLIAKAKGIDIRKLGSGNIGATNVNRNLGKKAGAITLVLDVAKGYLAVSIASLLAKSAGLDIQTQDFLRAAGGVAVVLGHCFSPWLRGKGGKGVATALGVFLGLAPYSTLITVICFIGIVKTTSKVALGSIISASILPILMFLDIPKDHVLLDSIAASLCAAIIILRHKDNISRMIRGNELSYKKEKETN